MRAAFRRVKAAVEHWLGGLMPGAAARRAQTAAYTDEWLAANAEAEAGDGPLWVVLGDSTSQAIGASSRAAGYVYRVLADLRRDGRPWRVVNLSRTGARVADVLGRQLPALDDIARNTRPELVSAAIGANDLLHRTPDLEARLREVAARLPSGSIIATLPQGLRPAVALQMNEVIKDAATRNGLRVADLWPRTGAPWRDKYSADHFHPNDLGYADWAAAFAEALDQRASDDRAI